jgi:hypothetical protein
MERVINTYCVIAAVAIFSLLAYECVDWAGLQPADWAAWAQAIGTVAAIGATIWLATRDDRRRRSNAHDLAVLTAASMTFRLSGALAQVRHISEYVDAAHKAVADPENLLIYANYIKSVHVCTDNEQVQLIPLPSRCAYRLAGTRDRLHAAGEALALMGVSSDRYDSERRKAAYGVANQALHEALDLLEMAVLLCQEASHGVTSTHPD